MNKMNSKQLTDHKTSSRSNPIHHLRVSKCTSSIKTDICACCLTKESPFIPLKSCGHRRLLATVHNFMINDRIKFVCLVCHSLLMKFNLFHKQVSENIRVLNSQTFQLKTNRKVCNLQHSNLKTFPPQSKPDYENYIVLNGDQSDTESYDSEETISADEEFDPIGLMLEPASLSPTTSLKSYLPEDQIDQNDNEQVLESFVTVPETEIQQTESEVKVEVKTEDDDSSNFEFETGSQFNSDSNTEKVEVVWNSSPNEMLSNAKTNSLPWNISKVKIVSVESKKSNPLTSQFKTQTTNEKSSSQNCHRDLEKSIPAHLLHTVVTEDNVLNTMNVAKSHRHDTRSHKPDGFEVFNESQLSCGNLGNVKPVVDKLPSIPESSPASVRFKILRGYEGKVRGIILTQEEFEEERRRERLNPVYLSRNYKCESCIVGFIDKQTYENHIKLRHSMIPGGVACNICKSVQCDEKRLKTHYENHFLRYECERCVHRVKAREIALTHYIVNHEQRSKKYICSQCDFETGDHRDYRQHLKTHKKMVECDICYLKFRIPSILKSHKRTVHEKVVSDKKYECEVCSKKFVYISLLKHHERTTHSKQLAYCVQCKTYYKNYVSLKGHLRYHSNHVNDDNKRYICDHCNERFINKNSVATHIKNKHFPDIRPKCHICSKTLTNRTVLSRHIESVHNKKKHLKDKICHYCGKGFTTNVILGIHIRTHTGERPLRCGTCDVTFAHPSSLFTHKRLKHAKKGQK